MADGTAPEAERPLGVLLCDDNAALRTMLRVVVESAADMHVVGAAADGDEAVAEATRLQPDVILLDIAMPRRSGLDALPELRLVAPRAQIVVFSGFSGSAVADEVLALGAASYLEKGATPEVIVATIERVYAEFSARAAPAAT